MSGELVHCKICEKDVPRADFLKHFRECSSKNNAAQANNPPAQAPKQKAPAKPSASTDISSPEYNDNLAAAMGMDASCLPDDYDPAAVDNFDGGELFQPAMARPRTKQKKRFEELFAGVDPSRLDYQGQRKYKLWKMKLDWKRKHMAEAPVWETGLQYLEESPDVDVAPCKFCRFFFPSHRLSKHERLCVQKPDPEQPEDDTFDPTAPVCSLQDSQRQALRRRGMLESHERFPAAPPPERRHPSPARPRPGVRFNRVRAAAQQRVEPAEHPEEDPPLVMDEILATLPENPYWLETVPRTLEAVQDVAHLMDEIRAPANIHQKPAGPHDEVSWGPRFTMALRRSRGARQRLEDRKEVSQPLPLEAEAYDLHHATRRALLEVAKEKLVEESSDHLVQPQAAESQELLEMEAWRRAVLKGNAWGDCYYPYSDIYLLTESTHHQALQRQAVITGVREAALYNISSDRKAALRQVYDDVHWQRMRVSLARAAERREVVATAERARQRYGPLHFT